MGIEPSEEVELDAAGSTWTGGAAADPGGVNAAELLPPTASGIAAAPDGEEGIRGIAAGLAEAGLGSTVVGAN